MRVFRLLAAVLVTGLPHVAGAQILPSRPITLIDGRLVIGGAASASVSTDRDEGYFNFTDYDHNALRLFRAGLTASLRASDRVSLLGEIQTENLEQPRAYAWYVRFRPWLDRPFDVQAGRIPPVFGGYSRRPYGQDLLIGYPLAYQYLTALRPDALPSAESDLIAMRGRGWLVRYPIGSPTSDHGLPLIAAFRWDTGVQVTFDSTLVGFTGAVTVGSLSNPRVRDDNDGKQVAGRLTLRPTPALQIGISGARGAYLSRTATNALQPPPASTSFRQEAFGADVELSRDYWLVRAEAVLSRWHLPAAGTLSDQRLAAFAISVEGRYKIKPGLYAAARIDRLNFSDLASVDASGQPLEWDAPVTRLEAGGGYQLARNILVKLTGQYNRRNGGFVNSTLLTSAQLLFWF